MSLRIYSLFNVTHSLKLTVFCSVSLILSLFCPPHHTGHVSADPAEDIVDDHDAAVDEEEDDDEDEVLVEEDPMQATVSIS